MNLFAERQVASLARRRFFHFGVVEPEVHGVPDEPSCGASSLFSGEAESLKFGVVELRFTSSNFKEDNKARGEDRRPASSIGLQDDKLVSWRGGVF